MLFCINFRWVDNHILYKVSPSPPPGFQYPPGATHSYPNIIDFPASLAARGYQRHNSGQ